MNAITATREIEFYAGDLPPVKLEITAIYIPEDEEWLLKPPSDYIEIIKAQSNLEMQERFRYIDNKLLDMGMDGDPAKWAREDEKAAIEQQGEAAMEEERLPR